METSDLGLVLSWGSSWALTSIEFTKLENFHYFQKKSINDDFFKKIKNINDRIFSFPFLFFGTQDAKIHHTKGF